MIGRKMQKDYMNGGKIMMINERGSWSRRSAAAAAGGLRRRRLTAHVISFSTDW